MPRTASKDQRLHLRVDAEAKRKLMDASASQHQSISEFVVSQALPAAERILENRHTTVLSNQDWDVFYKALLNPPAPTHALRDLMRSYRGRTEAS